MRNFLRHIHWHTVITPLALAVLGPSAVYATPQNIALNQMVVTGTRTEQPLFDSPVRTELITRGEIERYHARNVQEAIRLLPGALLQKIHGKTGYEVWLQGVDSNRVLVLIDGEPVSASTGSTVDLSQIGTANIEQIEVVKGATSALYGSNAIGGVINIITRKPGKPLSYSLRVDIGSFGEQNINGDEYSHAQRSAAGYLATKQNRWYGNASFDFVDSDGFKPYPHVWDRWGPESFKGSVRTRLGFTPTETQDYFVALEAYTEESEYRYSDIVPGNAPDYRTKWEEAERTTLKMGGAWQWQDWGDASVKLFSETFDDTTEQDSRATNYLEQSRSAELETHKLMSQWNLPIGEDHVLTSGIDYHGESLLQSRTLCIALNECGSDSELADQKPERDNVEFFVQDDAAIGDRVRLLPGFRSQYDSDFGDYFSPKINGSVELGDLSDEVTNMLRFGLGRGYRVPNLKERHYLFDHSQHGYVVNGNPDLQPESSNSLQLGWVYAKPGSYQLDVNLFYNRMTDLIETALQEEASDSNDSVMQYAYVNVAKAETRGGEISASVNPGSHSRLSLSYTYLEARDLDTGNHLGKRPRHQVKSAIDISPFTPDLTLSLTAQWQNEAWFDLENQNKAEGWSRFDFKANYQLTRLIKVYAGVDNITDTQRDFTTSFDLRPDEGRFVYLGMQFANE